MSRRLLLSIGLFLALLAGKEARAQAPVTPRGPTPVPEGAVPKDPKGEAGAGGEKETGRAPPPRVLPAEEPAVLRPSPAGTPGAPTGTPGAPTGTPGAPTGTPGAPTGTPGTPAGTASAPADASGAREAPAASGPPAAPAKPPAAPSFQWAPFGYLRVQATRVQQDSDVAFVGRSDGFSLQNARVGVRGALADRGSFELSIDGAVDERERVNVPNGRLRVGLRDAFVDLGSLTSRNPFAALPVGLSLRVGRFEAWFDPDGYDGDTERRFVDRALESRGVSATEGWETEGLPPGRSLGLAVRARLWPADPAELERGGVRLFGEAAMMNGAGEFSSGNDNDAVATSGALRLIAPERAWLQVAYRRNPRTEGELPFQQEEDDTAYSLGGGLSLGPVALAAGGVLQYTRFETTGGPRQRAWGAHGQAMVRVLGGEVPLEVGYRFAALDPSSLVVSDRLMEHSLGFLFIAPSLRSRLQVNLTHAVEQAARQLTNDRFEIALEVRL